MPAQAPPVNDPFVHEQAEAFAARANRFGQIQMIVFARWCSFVLVDYLHLKGKPFWSPRHHHLAHILFNAKAFLYRN